MHQNLHQDVLHQKKVLHCNNGLKDLAKEDQKQRFLQENEWMNSQEDVECILAWLKKEVLEVGQGAIAKLLEQEIEDFIRMKVVDKLLLQEVVGSCRNVAAIESWRRPTLVECNYGEDDPNTTSLLGMVDRISYSATSITAAMSSSKTLFALVKLINQYMSPYTMNVILDTMQ